MSDFVNTVDVLGDDAVCDGIITDTIAEYADDHILSVGEYAFYYCTKLTQVDLPNAINMGVFSFEYCTGLKTVNIPSADTVGNYAFYGDSSLESVNMPSVVTIGRNAFYNCQRLGNLDLSNLTSIGSNAFSGCYGMERVILRAPIMCELADTNAFHSSILFYVPDDLVETYKNGTNWSAYAGQIHAISELEG